MAAGVGGPKAGAARGLAVSFGRLRRAFVQTLHSRAELLSLEFARERTQIVHIVAYAIGALFFLTLAAFTATVFVIVLFWETHRVLAAGLLTLLYVAIAAGFGAAAKRALAQAAHPFAASLEQLRKDRDQLMPH